MQVKIEIMKDREGFLAVIPSGSVDNETYQDFHSKVAPALCETTRGILIDLKNVDYISSAGLGVLFTVKKYMMERGGELVFCNLKPQIKKLFEIVKTLGKETLFASHAEADAYFYAIMNEEISRQKNKQKP